METTIFGPPGTGKTTQLINIVQKELDSGTRPESIAFVSFSRKAAEEARTRAAEKLGMDVGQMVWFRTLHSFAYHCLGLTKERVLRGSDYSKIADLIGLEFSSNASLTMQDGVLFTAGKSGDAYLSMIQMARVTGRTLEEQFQITNDRHNYYKM